MMWTLIYIILIVFIIIIPIAWFLFPRAKRQFNGRIRRIRQIITNRSFRREHHENLLENDLYLPCIGDSSCEYNALSPYIRCAVNPSGPCEDCNHYKPKSSSDQQKDFEE